MALASYEVDGGVALVRMDDGKANALSDQMIAELSDALGRAEKEASAVVLAGRPDRFCAGFDLKVMMSGPEGAKALLRSGAALLMKIYGLPIPVVAACTGHALAGGALVLLASDVRIAAAGAFRIGLNEVSIGLPVPMLAMELARDRIATTELGRATMRAQIYGPDDAVKAGFVDEVVPAAELLARATDEAKKLGGLSRTAYHESKKRLRGRTIELITSSLDRDMNQLMSGT